MKHRSESKRKKVNKTEILLEPVYLVSIKENRNNCYDNISVNVDRGMPGHPLEKEIKDQESRDLLEQENDKRDYENHLQDDLLFEPNKIPHEPEYLIPIKGNRNNCYDNISINVDRGMPGNPLEKEIKDQESRELAEHKEDYENYLHEEISKDPKDYPLEPIYLIPPKENRNNCYDNISVNIDRGMPGHPLSQEISDQETLEKADDERDKEFYQIHIQKVALFSEEYPLEPIYLLPVKESRNSCYDNISINIDRLFTTDKPRESEAKQQEEAEEPPDKSDAPSTPDDEKIEGVFMQLEVSDGDVDFSQFSSSSSGKVRPPKSPSGSSPRAKKKFFSTYDPKIFYPSADPKRSPPPKVVHNKVKYPVKLKVTLKDIGLDGMDSVIPGRAAEIFYQERLKREKMKQQPKKEETVVWSPNQTNLSNQDRPSPALNQSQMVCYSSDDSYEMCNFGVDDLDDSPPPSPTKESKKPDGEDGSVALNIRTNHQFKVSEPKKKSNDGDKSPRRKKDQKTVKYDPSLFYTPYSTSSSAQKNSRARFSNGKTKYQIKLNVTLKEIGLEGLDSPVPSKNYPQFMSRPRKY